MREGPPLSPPPRPPVVGGGGGASEISPRRAAIMLSNASRRTVLSPVHASVAVLARRGLSSSISGVGTYEAVLPEASLEGKPNKYSGVITQRKTQGAGQAQLYATDVGKVEDGMKYSIRCVLMHDK